MELKWIPVSERLPDNNDMVLVTVQSKRIEPYVTRAYYLPGAGFDTWNMANVTAWMPLPEPYTEKK